MFKTILRDYDPEPIGNGLDEFHLDISGRSDDLEGLASEIRARVLEATGITCSVGIGVNMMLAKIACDINKPDG